MPDWPPWVMWWFIWLSVRFHNLHYTSVTCKIPIWRLIPQVTSELLMLVNQPKKWTLNGVINAGVFATLNGVTLRISNPKWHDKPESYPKWCTFVKTLPHNVNVVLTKFCTNDAIMMMQRTCSIEHPFCLKWLFIVILYKHDEIIILICKHRGRDQEFCVNMLRVVAIVPLMSNYRSLGFL